MENVLGRPPIVVVLGHVDHGKTSLLDAIRKTNVAQKEAGGITQKIGASVVTAKDGKKITFIDTPGHAAFSKMRSQGAKVADIAILVVAADDGVKPQTREAIEHIKLAGIPYIVAITKIDSGSANVEEALNQLGNEGVLLEKKGGDTPWIEVSAKEGRGIKELLELISLLADVSDIKEGSKGNVEAVIIESSKEKFGCVANIIVREGTLRVGDVIYTDLGACKIRSLVSEEGAVKEVGPGLPAQVSGFETVPSVGSLIRSESLVTNLDSVSRQQSQIAKLADDETGIFIKASNAGTLEAVLGNLPEKVVVVESGIGEVNESDILSAKSNNLVGIFVFESKVPVHVTKLAEAEGVKIYEFKIIYELFEKLEEIVKKGKVEQLGKAEIIASFPFDNKKVAGCKIVQGRVGKADQLVLMRGEKELGKIRILSIKKQKTEVSEAKQGEELGILFVPQLDFTIGDVILAQSK